MEENNYLDIQLKSNILHTKYLHEILTIEVAKKAVYFRKKFCNGKTYPNLVDCRSIKKFNKEARDYLSSEEATSGVESGAIVIESSFQATIANFFLKVTRPKIPTRIFTSYEKAEKWCANFINRSN